MKLPVDFRKNFQDKFHNKQKSATGFKAKSAISLARPASSPIFVLVAVVRSLTTIADASRPKFTELHPHSLLRRLRTTLPVSTLPPIVKPKGGPRRVLLLTSETALEAEVQDALRTRHQEREPEFVNVFGSCVTY